MTLCENPAILYDLITNSALKVAYKEGKGHTHILGILSWIITFVFSQLCFFCVFLLVIKHRCKPYFLELASLLLQRTMEEGHTDLMLKWGKKILEFIFRCGFVMYLLKDFRFYFIIIKFTVYFSALVALLHWMCFGFITFSLLFKTISL